MPEKYLLDLGKRNGGTKEFENEHAAAQFLANEHEKWGWLTQFPFTASNRQRSDVRALYTRSLAHVNEVKPTFPDFVESGLPLSSGPTGLWILKMHEDGFSREAAALVRACMTTKNWLDLSDPGDMNAVIELAFFERNLTSIKTDLVNDDLQDKVLSFEKSTSELISKGNAAISEITTTERAYAKHMELNASFIYWSQKASQHAKSERWLKFCLIFYAIASLVAVVGFPVTLGFLSGLNFSSDINLGTVWLFSTSLLLTSVAFWIGRVLTRFYLSQSHLRIDAEERATMVKSFVALTKEEAVKDTDRAIILAPLFRPTADGLVKDDAAPDMLAQLFSRLPKG